MAYREKPRDTDLDETLNEVLFEPAKSSSPTQSTSSNLLCPSALLLNTSLPPPTIRANTNNLLEHGNDDDDDQDSFTQDLDDVINQISRLRTDTSLHRFEV